MHIFRGIIMVHIRMLLLGIVLQCVGYNPYMFTSERVGESAAAAQAEECTQLSSWFQSIFEEVRHDAAHLIATNESYRQKLWDILLLAKNVEFSHGIYNALLLF